MKFITVEEKEPENETYYLVYCPDYCESEFAIAIWYKHNKHWGSEGFSSPVNDYVLSYTKLPDTK